MRAGDLNRQITIQSETIAQDADGFPTKTWADLVTVWAAVITTGGGEFYAAQKVNAETQCLFKVRYRTDITTIMRVKYGARYFEILALNDVDGKREETQISTKEVV